jgi:general nucleoside transport system ATP-binding protein
MALCDAVTVMRAGRWCWTAPIADTSLDGLAEAMVGRRVHLGRDGRRRAPAPPGAVLLQAEGLPGATRWACRGWTACR